MRSRTLGLLVALTCVCAIAAAVAIAAQQDESKAEAAVTRHSTNEKTPGAIREREIRMSPLVPIRPDAKVVRVVVTVGADGSSEIAYGEVSGPQVSCDESDDAVYCNTLGRFVFGPAGSLFDVRIADDISMTATEDDRCELDRFVLRVTGDRDQDGSGTALGEYTVHYALYEYCPGAHIFPRPIPGTEVDDYVVSAANAGNIMEITHPATGIVNLPSNVYLGVSFSRERCGLVVGAPATRGYSDDRFDYPGFPCAAGLGGFPQAEHASFYAEIYVRGGGCADTYAGYRNSNHGATSFSAGRNKLFADDIRPAADQCNLIGYQLAHRGNGIIQVDLKTALSPGDLQQAENGNLIPGTRAFIWSFGDDIQVHNQFFEPFNLSAYDQVWVAFKTTTAVAGPVLTCKIPALGETANLYMVYDDVLQAWTTVDGNESCWLGFDLTLFCEGTPPIGACCDMILTENVGCIGGFNHGNVCANDFDCPRGKCVGDSVCRELPEMNCAFPERWREGYRCRPVCVGGGNHGELCSNDLECTVCIAGRNDGGSCASDEHCMLCTGGSRDDETCCPAGSCNEGTGSCDGGDRDGQECCPDGGTCDPGCTGGTRDGQTCCPAGFCNAGVCVGGDRDGDVCCPGDGGACSPGICPTGECRGSFCDGGDNDGQPCAQQSDCPGGDCAGRGPFFPHPCGDSACCEPHGSCINTSERTCYEIAPLDDLRMYQLGQFCSEDQNCPLIACISRFGECTQARGATCIAGPEEGGQCNPDVNDCDAVCVDLNGAHWDQPCRFPQDCDRADSGCGRSVCVGGVNDGELCAFSLSDLHCPGEDSTCSQPLCKGVPGCEDAFCCTEVCRSMAYCCTTHWDNECALQAARICTDPPANDECSSNAWDEGAELLGIPSTVVSDNINATEGSDPGFCCYTGDPGEKGLATTWYKFVATEHTSARFSTCCTNATTTRYATYRAEDSLIQVFSVEDSDLGLCRDDITRCSVRDQDCSDGFQCELDEETICRNLNVVACSDDDETCRCGVAPWPKRSEVCVTDLVLGELYYVLVAAKTRDFTTDPSGWPTYSDLGLYSLNVSAPCTAGRDPLPNDLCPNAEVLVGGDTDPLVVPFDISGGSEYSPATFDCPGPSLNCFPGETMESDVWYDWTSPCAGVVTIDTCEWVCDGGPDFGLPCERDSQCGNPGRCATPDTGLAVYRGCECPADFRRELVCSDFRPYPCFLGSEVTFDAAEDDCFKLRLGGHMGGEPAGNLTINVTCDCPDESVTFLVPPSGVVDARQPHPPGEPSQPQGMDEIRAEAPLGCDVETATGEPKCWSICETGSPAVDISITGVERDFSKATPTFIVELNRPVTPGEAATLIYTDYAGGTTSMAIIAHPANVDGNGFSDGDDLTQLIAILNGPPPADLYSVDIDRSGQLGPADLLRLIDLLNGAATFRQWDGVPKPTAPVDCVSAK